MIQDIINRAEALKKETALGSVTPNRVGSIMSDTLQYINEAQIFADALIQKVYATEEAFNNDTERLSDLTGKPMKAGSIIYIQSNDTFYRYDGGNNKTVLRETALESVLRHKAEVDGRYPAMSVGFADNLAGRGESVPAEFTFRATGGKSIKDGAARIKRIKGNSVVWNNMVDLVNMPVDAAGVTATELDGRRIHLQGEFTGEGDRNLYVLDKHDVVVGHYYAVVLQGSKYYGIYGYRGIVTDPTDAAVVLATGTGSGLTLLPRTFIDTGTYVDEIVIPQIIDLTLMFGAGNEPATIEEFYSLVPSGIDLFAYNEGEVIHCNTESIKSVGDNAVSFGGEVLMPPESEPDKVKNYQEGYTYSGISASGYALAERVTKCEVYDGKVIVAATNGYGVGSFLEVLPNAEYHINASIEGNGNIYIAWYDAEKRWIRQEWSHNGVSPLNARYAMYCLIPNDSEVVFSDIMLTLVHSGWKQDTDAGYQEYWEDTLPLPIISKYFPQGMKSAGSAHDEIRYNKATQKWEAVQRIDCVYLEDLVWQIGDYNGYSAFYSRNNALNALWADHIFYLCAKYQPAVERIHTEGLDKSIALNNGYYGNPNSKDEIVVRDTDYTDVESFKASLQGVMLYYELAEPIVTEIEEPISTDYRVADFGTEQSQSSVASAAFRADIIYQFNAVDMIREHEMEINELQQMVSAMQAQLANMASMNDL